MMGFGMTLAPGASAGVGGFGLIGLILNVAIIVGVAVLIVWAVKRFSGGTANWNQSAGNQSSREILQARYARGEITREQYQQMLKDLS